MEVCDMDISNKIILGILIVILLMLGIYESFDNWYVATSIYFSAAFLIISLAVFCDAIISAIEHK